MSIGSTLLIFLQPPCSAGAIAFRSLLSLGCLSQICLSQLIPSSTAAIRSSSADPLGGGGLQAGESIRKSRFLQASARCLGHVTAGSMDQTILMSLTIPCGSA